MSKLKGDVSMILSEVAGQDLNDIDIAKFSSNMFKMLRENNLVLDKDITMLIRGILVMESSLKNLNDNLSLLSVLTNHIVNKNSSLIDGEKIVKAGKEIVKNTKSLVSVPNEVLTFFKTLNNGDNKIKFEMSGSTKQVDKIEKMLHELIIGIIDASLALSNEKNETIRMVLMVFIIILSVWLFIKMLIDHIHRGY